MLRPAIPALIAAMLAFSPVSAQTPAEKELQAPFNVNDGNPTPGKALQEPSIGRSMVSLVLVLGAVGGGLWALKRYGPKRLPGASGGRLKVQETLALGDRRFVTIVRADDEEFLLGLTPQGITLLARLDGVSTGGVQTFDAALAQQVDLTGPTPLRDVERLLKGGQ